MVERQEINSSEFRVPRTQNEEHRTQYEQLIQEVKQIYDWLDAQIESGIAEKCEACGKCCDFITFDHRLYVTTLEVMYLAANLDTSNLKSMQDGICPYNSEGKCTVYLYRFSGCRIFNCKADTEIQSQLSEEVLKKFKELCEKYQIPYRYMELSCALNQNTQT